VRVSDRDYKGKGITSDLGHDNLRTQDCDDVECRLATETLLEAVSRNKSQSTEKNKFEHYIISAKIQVKKGDFNKLARIEDQNTYKQLQQ
jgi:hypothetical protein